MSKVRVYELAKEYGIKGQDLANMLKEHGFDKVKSHMAVLDDATALHARAVIEAQGISASASAADSGASTMPRKKALPGPSDGDGLPAKKALPERKQLPERRPLPERAEMPARKPLPQHESAQQRPAPADAASGSAAPADGGKSGGADRDAASGPPPRSAADAERKPPPSMDEPSTVIPASSGHPQAARSVEPPASPEGRDSEPRSEAGDSESASAESKKPLPEPVSRTKNVAKRPSSGQSTVKTGTGATHDGIDEAERVAMRESESTQPSEPRTEPGTATASGDGEATEGRGPAAAAETPAAQDAPRPSADAGPAPSPTTTGHVPSGAPAENTAAASRSVAGPKAAGQPAEGRPAQGQPAQGQPAQSQPVGESTGPRSDTDQAAGAQPAAAADEPKKVKKLIAPQAKATVLGRIELPPEAIRDAKRRSAPSTGRNPGSVDRNLRRAALRSTQSRSAAGRPAPGRSSGPVVRRGPGVGGRGRGAGGRGRGRQGTTTNLSSTVDPNKVIEITPPISVKALSEAIGVRVNDLIATLTFKLGVIGKHINSFLSNDEIELIGFEVNRNIKLVEQQQAEEQLLREIVSRAEDIDSTSRAPVVTFMGHVDHGKTSLLDALRQSDVVKGEAGGITQHVGAYKITWNDGSEFVVLDTPGHEAFTQMRVRGAKLTDIVVLVVAADDGVMPQTEEAISHARAAEGTQIIVAINKCDRPQANPMQVRQQLAVKGLQPEEWGGDVPMIEVSALTGQGLDDLVEQIMLRAEVFELTAKPDAAGEAVVIESRQTPEQGVTVDVLVTNGTLRVRDQVLCGESLSRIRGIIDDHGNSLAEAPPSTPCRLLGVDSLPNPGDKLFVVNDKKKAKEVIEDRERHARNLRLAERSKASLEALTAKLQSREIEEIKIILKADVMGSLEPIKTSLARLDTEEVKVNVVHSALGGITETDVSLAEASGAMIIGFNSVADQAARQAADRAGVDIRFYGVIYELVDEVKQAMEGRLKPAEVEEPLGVAEIRAVFRSSKFGNIAGCYVTDGIVRRNAFVRLVRDSKVVYQGTVSSLRREKDDAKEVRAGFECGLTLKDYNDIKEGDVLHFHEIKYVKRTLD